MNETSKSMARRFCDYRYFTKYFKGHGMDIGAGRDGLSNYMEFMPMVESIYDWDIGDGDAQYLDGVENNSFDFIHSSHCLEHLQGADTALYNWLRVLKVGGYMVVTVPDMDLYEQGIWPSNKNPDHKYMFTLNNHIKSNSNYNYIWNVPKLLSCFNNDIKIIKMELLDMGYRYNVNGVDQTLGAISESAIEFIIQKIK